MLSWCCWTVVLEETLESPLDCKEIQPVHPKGTQSWVFIGRTDVEAETLTLWPSDVKSWLTGKDPDAGKDWGLEGKRTTEDEDGWMASPTQWTWLWVNYGSWWWTGRPGMLQFMGLQKIGHDWVTELNWEKVLFVIFNALFTCSEVVVAQLCSTLGEPMGCSPPVSSVHGIFQARIPEWVAISFSHALLTLNTLLDPNSMGRPYFFPHKQENQRSRLAPSYTFNNSKSLLRVHCLPVNTCEFTVIYVKPSAAS